MKRQTDWSQRACAHLDTDYFFPPTKREGERRASELAASHCHRCPVRKQCQAVAEAYPNTIGVWAGRYYTGRKPTTISQVASYLLTGQTGGVVRLHRGRLGEDIGCSEKSISRALMKLQNAGAIQMFCNHSKAQILDASALQMAQVQ